MQTKLTLRLDDRLIRRAKQHARRAGKSLSVLVAEYFEALGARQRTRPDETPVVRELYGALTGCGLDERDYREHLDRRHR